MDRVALFRIGSLHARAVQENGLRFRHRGREILTGPVVAQLDDRADPSGNLGLVNLSAGAVRLRWSITVTLPFLADAAAAGLVPEKDGGPLRVRLEESGGVLPDGSGVSVRGTGHVLPGSFFSQAGVAAHANLFKTSGGAPAAALRRAATAGDPVACVLVPEASHLDVALPRSLGGGTQRLNLTGGFSLLPVMTLPAAADKAGRRRG
jgi:hypothetical protein